MELTVNGKKQSFSTPVQSLVDVLTALGLDPERSGLAVAINFSVIPRAKWAATAVAAGDQIEVISATAGG